MSRHSWHPMPKLLKNRAFIRLTAAVRGVLLTVRELLHDDPVLSGNVSDWATWTGIDRKTVREAFVAIEESGLLYVAKEERGKEGTIYTLAHPDHVPTSTQPDPNLSPTSPQPDPKLGPDKSPISAGLRPASLGEEILPTVGEKTRAAGATHAHAREGLAAAASDLEALEVFWASKKGRIPPLGPGEVASMREALELPGATLPLVKEIVGRRFEQAKSRPSACAYFLPAIRDELQRRNLMAAPLATNPGPPTRAAPAKPRITDRSHYLWLVENGLLDDSWANPDEFAQPQEAS